ncbi:hypothetical protein SD71_07570 [Cohnella kolymensis]|uniref:Uncharacterized protein n=1 Tax=Cohnella kolymensis TaxID=1590652 RepID=A0ABR5A6B4_9BACL|nr:hypothetical protein SD71_07570 [Cohnella kolymensis]
MGDGQIAKRPSLLVVPFFIGGIGIKSVFHALMSYFTFHLLESSPVILNQSNHGAIQMAGIRIFNLRDNFLGFG